MSGITLLVEDPKWRSHRGLMARLTKAAEAARRSTRLKGGFTILLANDKKLRALNHDFRGHDKPTNVLSFPGNSMTGRATGRFASAAALGYAGDIAIAYGVTSKEAKAAAKSLADHATHLVVHGVLHLAGYDHEAPQDAKVMEPLEVKVLKRLGIADPYAASP
ncbi:MAG TPA: rRNA maturation RNase YbeY [Rhizomicrobium sp.]|jgi:probable rRNA maturation factor|nr:rRNA maturation RNase YbeY [Rhizomicrobium sp.]